MSGSDDARNLTARELCLLEYVKRVGSITFRDAFAYLVEHHDAFITRDRVRHALRILRLRGHVQLNVGLYSQTIPKGTE
jgi:hypothetical protein